MTDTNNLDNKEITDLLFKDYLGFPSTDEGNKFYEEPTSIKYNNYLIGNQILLDDIPKKTLSFTDISLTNLSNDYDISLVDTDFKSYDLSSVQIDNTGVILKFTKIKLSNIDNNGASTDAFYKLDNNNKNVLQDALQYNYNSYDYDGEINQPYLYSLYDTYDEERS